MNNPYEVLGIYPEADDATIDRAYRAKSISNHPDLGGDVNAFKELKYSYDLLKDPVRRAYFDETGEDSDTPDRASETLSDLTRQAFRVLGTDPIRWMKSHMEREIKDSQRDLDKVEKTIQLLSERLEKFKEQTHASEKAKSVVIRTLTDDIAEGKQVASHISSEIEFGGEVLFLIKKLATSPNQSDFVSRPTLGYGMSMNFGKF